MAIEDEWCMVVVSSCRGCWVKSRNRLACAQLPALGWGLWQTASDKPERPGMTSNHPCLQPGLHPCYNGAQSREEGRARGFRARPIKHSQFRTAVCNSTAKMESLVIANQHVWQWAAILGPYTHRPSH